ncbi:MAG: hypothetical protein J7L91_05755, partial [Candidatus Korarchaeota archaeon]|nr:hypothetical protein [Candidatus Korarchaeota archaeon]
MRKTYVIAALVVLLGASLLPAMAYPIHLFPQPFVQDGTIDYDFDGMPDVAIILGSKAAPEDVLGATLIAAKIASHLYYTNAMWVDAKHAEANGITLYHGSFTAEAYGLRYQALKLVGDWTDEDTFWGFLWSWNWDPAAGDPDPFNQIYPLHDGYVFVPAGVASVQNPTQIDFSIGLSVDPDALKEWVVFAPGFYPPAYTQNEKDDFATSLTFDCPGTFVFDYDAWDTTKDYDPVGDDDTDDLYGPITYTWDHAGFYFIHPLNPVDVKIDTQIDLPWAGYTLVADTVEVDEPDTYSVGFIVYKLGTTTPVDYFHIENSVGVGDQTTNPKDNDPDTFQTFLYSMIHRDMYILADIDGDGVISDDEKLVPYLGITVRDTDAVLQVVTMDFYSLILAPNIYPGYGDSSVTSGDTAFDWDNTIWFFDDTYGWPHPANSDYVDAADPNTGSSKVDVILELSSYPDPTGPRVFAGGNMRLTNRGVPGPNSAANVQEFKEAKGYIVDEQTVFGPWLEGLAEDEHFYGISGYNDGDDWYMVVKAGTLGATIFTENETGWYEPLNEDGHLVVGGVDYWFTSVVSQVITAYEECAALPPGVAGEYCGPACGPTWGIYEFVQKDEILKKLECDAFAEPDELVSELADFPLGKECGKNLTFDTYATWEDEDVTLAVYHWQLNWIYPINATGVFAGIYDRVEDRDGDGIFTGATELV